jgi:hypothetical protein
MVDVFYWCLLRQESTTFKGFFERGGKSVFLQCFPTRCFPLVPTSAVVHKFQSFLSEAVTEVFSYSSMLDVFP